MYQKMILVLTRMVQTWCNSISSQFHISWEQLEILILLCLSLAFGYLLLRICDVVLFGQTTTTADKLHHSLLLFDEGDPSTYDYVHIRPNTANETGATTSEEEENLRCKTDTDFHFNMPQHVREEEEDNLETIIGSTPYSSKVAAHIEAEVTSYSSPSSLQGGNNSVGLKKRKPSQLESTAHREISAVEGEEGYVMVTKK